MEAPCAALIPRCISRTWYVYRGHPRNPMKPLSNGDVRQKHQALLAHVYTCKLCTGGMPRATSHAEAFLWCLLCAPTKVEAFRVRISRAISSKGRLQSKSGPGACGDDSVLCLKQ